MKKYIVTFESNIGIETEIMTASNLAEVLKIAQSHKRLHCIKGTVKARAI